MDAIGIDMTAPGKNKHESLLQQLIFTAGRMNIEVRTEKLLREIGYHARSGRCLVKGQHLIIVDRDAPIRDQVEFLAEELTAEDSGLGELLPIPVKLQTKPLLRDKKKS